MEHKYHYFYKITNLLNNHFYYGIHSTDNLNDGYFGSGQRLKMAIKLYGRENFKKEILKFFDSREKLSEYEALIVNENCIADRECYNMAIGGDKRNCMLVVDSENNYIWLPKASETDAISPTKGKTPAFNKLTQKNELVDLETYYNNKDIYISLRLGFITVKDKDDNYFNVSIDDEKYLNKELVPVFNGRKHTEETKKKMSQIKRQNKSQCGEKNSMYNHCWITKDGQNKNIDKSLLSEYINQGWTKGRYFEKEKYNFQCKSEEILNYDDIKQCIESGMTNKEICKKYNIGKNTFLRYRKRHNLPIK